MSKIHNSIYGLSLGDAIGYRTEFIGYKDAVEMFGDENIKSLTEPLLVSDDTQMSLYMLKAFEETYDHGRAFDEQFMEIMVATVRQFLIWRRDPENYRAPGLACMGSLQAISQGIQKMQKGQTLWDVVLEGDRNGHSKGSGTVMRSPWIGILNAIGTIPDEELSSFASYQSSITHHHPTALDASYLTALLTSKLYKQELHPGQLEEFTRNFISQQEQSLGWDEILDTMELMKRLPDADEEYDFSHYLGRQGTAECVLVTAIAIIDKHGRNPLEVLRRSMLSGGDSDTIGAVAGGMIGAYYDEPIWEGVEHLVEKLYVPQLDHVVAYIENLDKK